MSDEYIDFSAGIKKFKKLKQKIVKNPKTEYIFWINNDILSSLYEQEILNFWTANICWVWIRTIIFVNLQRYYLWKITLPGI